MIRTSAPADTIMTEPLPITQTPIYTTVSRSSPVDLSLVPTPGTKSSESCDFPAVTYQAMCIDNDRCTHVNPMEKVLIRGGFATDRHHCSRDKLLQSHYMTCDMSHVTMDGCPLEDEFQKMNVSGGHQSCTRTGDSITKTPVCEYGKRQLAIETALKRANNDGDTILHLAIIHCAKELIFRLLKEKVDICFYDIQNKLHQTPLHLAVLTHQVDVVRILVVRGVSTSLRDAKGNTALHLACISGDLSMVKALTAPIATRNIHCLGMEFVPHSEPLDASLMNYNGDTCLHLAAAGGHVTILRYLSLCLMIGDVNIGDGKSGRTILHHAIESRNAHLLLFLLQNRTHLDLNIHKVTYSGHSAADLAAGRKSYDLVKLLELVGATQCDSSDDDAGSEVDVIGEDDTTNYVRVETAW